MKRFVNIACALTALSGIAASSSCNEGPDVTDPVPAEPASLAVSNIGNTAATFLWEGNAETYEITISTESDGAQVVNEIIDAKAITASTLARATAYTWKVRALNGEYSSEWVDGTGFSTAGALQTPTALDVSEITRTGATFTWTGSESTYEISITTKNAETDEVTEVVSETVGATTFTTNSLTRNTVYSWRVRAKDGDYYGAWADGEDFPTDGTVDAPTSPAVSGITKNTATFTWTGSEPAYEVVVSTESDGAEVATETVEGNSLTIYTLTPETDYTWKVRAVVGDLHSDWVDGEGFTSGLWVDLPTNLEVLSIMRDYAAFRWAGSSPAYEISISTKSDGTEVINRAAEIIPHDVYGLTPGTAYTWKVRGKDGERVSAWVDGPEFSTKSAPTFAFTSAKVELLRGDATHLYRLTLSDGKGITAVFDIYRTPGSNADVLPSGKCTLAAGGTGDKQIDMDNSYVILDGNDPNSKEKFTSGAVDVIKASYGTTNYTFNVIDVMTESGIKISYRTSTLSITVVK